MGNRHNPQKLNMPKGAGLIKPMKLSAELADIVGKKEASRAECIKQLWAYIKKNNLQDPENKQFFVPDKKMAKVFGNDRIRFRYGQVPLRPLVLNTHSWLDNWLDAQDEDRNFPRFLTTRFRKRRFSQKRNDTKVPHPSLPLTFWRAIEVLREN